MTTRSPLRCSACGQPIHGAARWEHEPDCPDATSGPNPGSIHCDCDAFLCFPACQPAVDWSASVQISLFSEGEKDMQLRVKIGPKLGIGNFQEVQTLDGASFQVGKLTIPYADHAVTPATVANLRANGFYRDGENIWIDEAADPLP